jgi:protein-disulfide isomerase
MIKLATALRALALTLLPALFIGAAHAAPLTPDQDAQVRTIVRDYLLKNPEVLEEAQAVLNAKRAAERRARLAPKLERDPRRFSIGPANAKITIVEFFDYRCPYCKASFDWTQAQIKASKDVRLVYIEFPILGPNSLEASRAAVASMKQGKYLPFHDAMMRSKGQLDTKQIDQIAKTVGIDVPRMRRDMGDPAIMTLLQDDQNLASEEKVDSTPTFVINGEFYTGFQPDEMDKALRRIRAKG